MKTLLAFVYSLCLSVPNTLAAGRYLSQQEAIDIDVELFNDYKFSVDQLMELAGLSAASAIANVYTPRRTLVFVGPGNNGGDGLVCARHLKTFKFPTTVYCRKQTPNPLYENLAHQCASMNITFLKKLPPVGVLDRDYDLIVDAVFGVSFKPPVRGEFIPIIDHLWETVTPICSIDVPSGWHVEMGPSQDAIRPEFLISLSAPKQCAKFFEGKYHYLGGRFLPPALQEKYNLSLPEYPDNLTFVRMKF